MVFLVGALLLLGGGSYLASFWFQREADAYRARAAAEARYPELQQAEVHAQNKLGHYRVVDEANGVFQIPIERAMEVLAQEPGTATVLTSEVRY